MRSKRLPVLFAALLMSSVTAPEPACAHPHVWVDARVALDMTEQGTVTALKVTWRLDELYTQTVIAGLDENADGTYDPSELHPLVEEAVQNLEEWSYFTDVRAGTARVAVGVPDVYRAYMDADLLVYEFTLPLPDGTPQAGEALRLRLFDPSYYISIALEKERPVTLDQAPDACTRRIEPAPGFKESLLLSESTFLQEAEPNTEGLGGSFAETIVITCE